MRFTLQSWWCGVCRTQNGPTRTCAKCGQARVERYAQVRASERAVVYLNPATGERRVPARADLPMPEVYARQGFERHEISSMSAFERATGLVHEATNFAPGCEPAPCREPEHPPAPAEVTRALVDDFRAAAASGPWTERSEDAPASFALPVRLGE